jgi:oligoribonuclease NrnB/cAMP/cGMP phosphodiesterase (DHH superfamily)
MQHKEQYRKILNRKNKILNVHHKDLDGVASSIVVKNVYDNVDFKALRYGQVNEFLKNLDYSQYDAVLLTDISPESMEAFSYSDKLFLLDHHDTALQYHAPEKNRIVLNGVCAAKLVQNFFKTVFMIDLSYLDEFVNLVNDYDMWILNDPRSWEMNEIYFKYWDSTFRARFKTGNVNFNHHELAFLKERKKLLDTTYNELKLYDFDSINGTVIVESSFVNDLTNRLLREKNYDVVCCVNPKSKHVSVRTKDPEFHLGEHLRLSGLGGGTAGGHHNAAAFSILEGEDTDNELDKFELYMKKNWPKIRKGK